MAAMLISYDVLRGNDYTRLYDELERLGGCRVLFSTWLVRGDSEPKALADHLEAFINADDRLIVAECPVIAWTESLLHEQQNCILGQMGKSA